jgi:peptide/nickel transport system permease protein
MRHVLARQAVRLVVGILGAGLVATAIAAVGEASAHTMPAYLTAFGHHLWNLLRLDFGTSTLTGRPALEELGRHLPSTLMLVAMGAGVAGLVGVPLGLLFAFQSARRIAAPLVQIITATPVFCAGLALAYAAAYLLQWPTSVNAPARADVLPDQALQLLALPVLTVGLAGAGAIHLALRRATIRSSEDAYRTGLKRLGLGRLEIEALYVVPKVLAGVLTGAGEIMLALVSAAVVAEWVFHRGGAADLFVKSVALADWNMTAILLFVFAGLTIAAHFIGAVLGYLFVSEEQP